VIVFSRASTEPEPCLRQLLQLGEERLRLGRFESRPEDALRRDAGDRCGGFWQ
jgi:hypothetical protein